MKKSTMKVLSFVMALMMIVGTLAVVPFSALPGTVGSSNNDVDNSEKHTHVKGTLVETVEPTCELYGYSVYICSDPDCGEAFLADVTEPTFDHVWKEYGEVPATCEAEGMTAGVKCEKCGQVQEGCEVIPKSHVVAYKIVDLDDCLKPITFVSYCKVCGKTLDDEELGDREDVYAREDVVKKAKEKHNLRADIITAPTCTADGVADIYCEDCSFKVEGVAVEKLGHDWEEKIEDATLFEDAKKYKQCKDCGAIDKYEKDECDHKKGDIRYFSDNETQGTSHASILGEDDATVKEVIAAIDNLKAGQRYEKTYVFDGKVYTYVKEEPECSHKKWNTVGYFFSYKEGEDEVVVSSDEFQSVEDFIRTYAANRDRADLYVEYKCNNAKCGETKKEVVFKKLGHIYDTYTFELRTEINEVVYEVRETFEGYDDVTYFCGQKPVEEKLCAFCAARAIAEAEAAKGSELEDDEIEVAKNSVKITSYLGNVQAHKYVAICQNTECEENEKYEYDGKTWYACTNCAHAHLEVCFNKDTREEDGLCKHCIVVPEGAKAHVPDTTEEFTMPATCVEKAYLYNKCKVCGSPVKIEGTEFGKIDENNHDWTVTKNTATITLQEATCTTPGRLVHYCNRYGCDKYITDELPIDTENGHALYTRDAYGRKGLSREYVINNQLALDPNDVEEATCTTPKKEKWYCDICKQIIYIEIEDSILDNTVRANHKNLKTVEAQAQNCITGETYAYTYCKDCGTIIDIYDDWDEEDEEYKARDVLEEELNIAEDLDKIVAPNAGTLFTPDEWEKYFYDEDVVLDENEELKGVFGGDANIKYEVITDASGNPITYKIISGGKGHRMVLREGFEATCFNAGLKDKYYCKVCDFKDEADKNGAQIRPIAHKNAKNQAIKAGDADRVVETWKFAGATGVTNEQLQQIWALRAIDVKDSEVEGGKDYKIAYVPATCTEDGYIVGKYCPDCMNLIPDEDDKDVMVPNEYFNVAVEDDPATEEVDETLSANIAGYKLEKKDHATVRIGDPYIPEEIVCGEDSYKYTIEQCENCKEYLITGFSVATEHDAHKIVAYAADDDELGVKKGDAVIYTLGLIGEQYVIIEKNEQDGKYYRVDSGAEYKYLECVDTIYTGKRCEYCGSFLDVEEIAPTGHYTTKLDGTKEVIDITCTNYKDYIGLTCDVCGLEVPNVVIEKDDKGRDVEVYYSFAGAKLEVTKNDNGIIESVNNGKYFVIDHDWAIPEDDCEALNADILACAACGINIVNKSKAANYHKYYHFVENAEEAELAKFDIENFEDYAFDDVTYPTTSVEGFGTITCQVCFKTAEVVIPVREAVATASFDTDDTILIGNTVTVTVNVSAKDFAFREIKLFVADFEDRLELVDAEIVYPFAAIDSVRATIGYDEEGTYVAIRTPGIANRNVTISGENVPFIKLTYKIGDLFGAKETIVKTAKIGAVEVLRFNEETKAEDDVSDDFDISECGFGDIKVYNPAYDGSVIGVLSQIYSTDYTNMYDFNKDGRVDLDDYFALADYIDSKETIADFCALIGYDVDAMLDTLDYAQYSSQTSISTGIGQVKFSVGTEADIAYAKSVIKREMAKANYKLNITEIPVYEAGEIVDHAQQTIADFAQKIIKANTL